MMIPQYEKNELIKCVGLKAKEKNKKQLNCWWAVWLVTFKKERKPKKRLAEYLLWYLINVVR